MLAWPLYSQNSFPTAVGTTWEYVSLNYFDFGTFVGPFPAFTDQIVKDTSIAGATWHKVMRNSSNSEDHWFFRTDANDRVYILDSVLAGQAYESLLFDYSLQAGGTFYGPLRSVQDLGSTSIHHDYSSGPATLLEGGNSPFGPILIPANQNAHYMEFLPGVGQIAYEFRCLADFCPDPNFYLASLSNGNQIYYERNFASVGVEETLASASFSAYPNPCIDHLRIAYQLTHTSAITLELFDLNGKKVYTLLRDEQAAGSHEIFLHPAQTPLKRGVYQVRLTAGDQSAVKKILYLGK